LVFESGGFKSLPFGERDCRNYINKARELRLGKGGGQALCDYFNRMQKQNSGFYYTMEMDDDFRLRNVFWADARSRSAYEFFGDVITFDTTYLTNRYDMPFTPFVGVNHRGQSILLGAGLISSENINTFVWLFKSWLGCMNGRTPRAIIADQDRAMQNTIAIVFPETRHRYCLWQIMRKLPEKFGAHANFDGIKSALQSCLYDSQTIEVIKSIEPYSSTKGTLREEVCSRLIKPTTQVYLGNVGLLTRPLTCGTIVQTRVQREGRPNIVQGPEALIP
jgi:hypothetical protein